MCAKALQHFKPRVKLKLLILILFGLLNFVIFVSPQLSTTEEVLVDEDPWSIDEGATEPNEIAVPTTESESGGPTAATSFADWCYDKESCGPSKWPGKCSSGLRQSPINIPTAKLTMRTNQNTRLKINKNYALPKSFFVKNTGHTLQVLVNADTKSKCYLIGDGLGESAYYFSQLHFHWGPNNLVGSEHLISGKAFPLEMHMVHQGVKNPAKIAVISVLFYLSPNDNKLLEPILSLAANVTNPGDIVRSKNPTKITLTSLLPKRMRMFRYAGSLTTPPCTETVTWTIFRDAVPVSKRQMSKFRKLNSISKTPITKNFRPVKPAFTKSRKSIFFVRQLKTNQYPSYNYYHPPNPSYNHHRYPSSWSGYGNDEYYDYNVHEALPSPNNFGVNPHEQWIDIV